MKDGRTPLHAAVAGAKAEAVTHLLEKGADPTLTDDKGQTPWQALWYDGNATFNNPRDAACAIALLDADIEIPEPPTGGSYLHVVARRVDSPALIKALVDAGEDVMSRDNHGWTPLHVAAEAANGENVAALLAADADPNAELTETWIEERSNPEGTKRTVFRFQKGSRPLDVARYGSSRVGTSGPGVIKEFGGTKNPDVKNLRGRSRIRI
jgi:ankyrin repeat protein